MSSFDDIFAANTEFIKGFKSQELTGEAKKGLAIITCMDSRIDPLRIVGMKSGDAKILRNAGARVTEDVQVIIAKPFLASPVNSWDLNPLINSAFAANMSSNELINF